MKQPGQSPEEVKHEMKQNERRKKDLGKSWGFIYPCLGVRACVIECSDVLPLHV